MEDLTKKGIVRKADDIERYNTWFVNNYETGMERLDPKTLVEGKSFPDYKDDYYEPTPIYHDNSETYNYFLKLKRNLKIEELINK